MGCKHCKKDLEHLPGKRKKEFCNYTCRSNFWQKERRKKNNAVKLEKEKKEPEPVVPHEKEESKEEKKKQPVIPKNNDPKEGSMAFHLKYGASTYAEAEKLKDKL